MLILLTLFACRASKEEESVGFVGIGANGLNHLSLLEVGLDRINCQAGNISLNRFGFHIALLSEKEGGISLRFRGRHSVL